MKIVLMLNTLLVLATIFTGIVLMKWKTSRKKFKKILQGNLAIYIPLMVTALIFLGSDAAFAATTEGAKSGFGLGFMAAALSTGLATIGAGYAVGAVGSSALGAVSEDPKILGKTLIFVGLAEGIAIYGLIISILILGRL